MKTTNYVLELMIAGLGAMAWVIWLILSCLNPTLAELSSVKTSITGLPTAVLAAASFITLSFIYIAGIILDRTVDEIFDRFFRNKIIKGVFSNKSSLSEDSNNTDLAGYKRKFNNCYFKIVHESSSLKEIMDYQKIKIRITRAWTMNSFLIFIFFNTFLIRYTYGQDAYLKIFLLFSTVWGLATFLSFRAWQTLTRKECELVAHHYSIVGDESSEEQKT